MSKLNQELINQFAKLLNSQNGVSETNESVLYGTAKVSNGDVTVLFDGADIETPCDFAVTVKNGDRVKVELRNHTAVVTANMTDQAASSSDLKTTTDNLAETAFVVAALNATTIRTDNFSAKIAQISDADITSLSARTVNADSVTTAIVNATDVQAETIGSKVVNAETIKAAVADVGYLTADKIEAETGDFLKIHSEKLDADIALLRDVIIEDSIIKGTLDAININAANIVAGQLIVDRFIKHDLETDTYRVLELDDEGQEYWGTINGDVLTEYSINANKINVADLFAQNIVVYNKFYSDNYEPSEYKQYSVLVKKPSDWDDEAGNSYYVYSESEEDYVEITRPFPEFEAWKYYKHNDIPVGSETYERHFSKEGMLIDFEPSNFRIETPYMAVYDGKLYAEGGIIKSNNYKEIVGSTFSISGLCLDFENGQIKSKNFAVDSYGKIYAKEGKISNFEITESGLFDIVEDDITIPYTDEDGNALFKTIHFKYKSFGLLSDIGGGSSAASSKKLFIGARPYDIQEAVQDLDLLGFIKDQYMEYPIEFFQDGSINHLMLGHFYTEYLPSSTNQYLQMGRYEIDLFKSYFNSSGSISRNSLVFSVNSDQLQYNSIFTPTEYDKNNPEEYGVHFTAPYFEFIGANPDNYLDTYENSKFVIKADNVNIQTVDLQVSGAITSEHGKFGDISGKYIDIVNGNGIQAYNSKTVSPLYLNYSGGDVNIGKSGGTGSLKVNGTNVSLSGHTHSYLPLSGGTLTGALTGTRAAMAYGTNATGGYSILDSNGNIRTAICLSSDTTYVNSYSIATGGIDNQVAIGSTSNTRRLVLSTKPASTIGTTYGVLAYNLISIYNSNSSCEATLRVVGDVGTKHTIGMNVGTNGNAGIWDFTRNRWDIYSGATGTTLYCANTFSPSANNTYTLGDGTYRWKQLYANTATISTSDRNLKKEIKSLSEDERMNAIFDGLKPCSFMFKTGDRTHLGFIAQDVEDVLTVNGSSADEFSVVCKDVKKQIKDGKNPEDKDFRPDEDYETILDENGKPVYEYGLRYEEFIALNTMQIQKLKTRVAELESIVNKLTKN